MSFTWRSFSGCVHLRGFWWRIKGEGFRVAFPWSRPMFSERYGYRKPVVKLFGFRVFRLEAAPEREWPTLYLLELPKEGR